MKLSFLNTNFNNISFGLSKGSTTKFKRGKFEGPSSDVFEKRTEAETTNDKRITNDKKNDINTVKPWAKRLSNDADAAYKIFRTKMENVFSPVCNYETKQFDWLSSEDCKGMLVSNKKSLTSIIEKMLSGGKQTEKEARSAIKDAIRARIVLTKGSQEEGDAICNEIIKAVKKGKLEIKHIKNYTTNDDMQYISPKMIKKLKKIAEESAVGHSYQYTEKAKPTGYNAVHIIFKIDDEFDGELQIMGRNVENLKDVEDVFYKLSDNKHVSKNFKELEKKYKSLASKNQAKLDEALTSYTRDAYIYERRKELGRTKDLYKGRFLPLDTAKHDLPIEFDFNNVAFIKNSSQ